MTRSAPYHSSTDPRTRELILSLPDKATVLSLRFGIPAYTIRRIRRRALTAPKSQTRLSCKYHIEMPLPKNLEFPLKWETSCNGVEVNPNTMAQDGCFYGWKYCPFCGAVIDYFEGML